MKTSHLFIGLILIGLLVCTVTVSAIDLKAGATVSQKTAVNLTDGVVVFTDTATEMSVTTLTKIDGDVFKPSAVKEENGELTWITGEKDILLKDNPVVSIKYNYTGDTLKETIVLKVDKALSFPVSLSKDTKLIPWDNGQWKVVSATSGDTMAGIVAEKPYGIDAKGNRIEMEYKYTDGELNLVYDKFVINYTKSEIGKNNYTEEHLPITYPLTIDPTWTKVGDHWVTTDGSYTIIMWNTTGTTSWIAQATSVQCLIIGGGASGGYGSGGAGGGGGAGGVETCILSLTPATSYPVIVGYGGSPGGNNGGNSNFSTIRALGGGKGGTNGDGGDGGSGGGGWGEGDMYHYSGGAGTPGQGQAGADSPGVDYGGAGGGNSTAGSGLNGGMGWYSSITGTNTSYAGGGGGANIGGTAGGTGGIGGGGQGMDYIGHSATAGTNGLGGGAGGGGPVSGGNGVVIIRFLTAPNASFTSNKTFGTTPLPVRFNDTSTAGAYPIRNWNWSINGTTWYNFSAPPADARNISYTFIPNGTHLVTLTVSNNTLLPWVSTATKYIYVNITPVANFNATPTEVRVNQTVYFVDMSTVGVTQWWWNFGDYNTSGYNTSTLQNPTHTYITQGKYSINLTVQGDGYNGNLTRNNYITAGLGLELTYKNSQTLSIINTGQITAGWNNGNGTGSWSGTEYTTDGHMEIIAPNGTITITSSANGFSSTTNDISLTTDGQEETIYLVPEATSTLVTRTHDVKIRIVDAYGVPLPGCNVSAISFGSTLAAESWLTSIFGLSAGMSPSLLNATMVGLTGGDGATVFTMLGTINYGILITNTTSGINHAVLLNPSDSEYVIYCPLPSQAPKESVMAQLANSTLYISEPNSSYVTFNLLYQDTSGYTTNLNWNVTCWTNQTVMYSKDFGNPGTSIILDNYTVPNVRGEEYRFLYDALRDVP